MSEITKTVMDCYRLRNNGEWATICVHAYEVPDLGADRLRQGGEVLIYSSYGSFAYHWSHCGMPFREFLTTISRDYTMCKFLGLGMKEFDREASIKAVKATILRDRREGSLTHEQARDLWEDTQWLDECETSEGFVYAYNEGIYLRKWDAEGYEFIHTKEKGYIEHFWKEIWEPFIACLKQEIEDAKPKCCVCGTKENLHEDRHLGSKVWRCASPDCMVL